MEELSLFQRVISKMLCSSGAVAGKAMGIFITRLLGALLSLHLESKIWSCG